MRKGILAFRYGVLAIISIAIFLLLARYAYWCWLWINNEPDPVFLVATEDVVFNAGDQKVKLPKGIVLYSVAERETADNCYPGGQYKIYVQLETDASGFNAVEWPKNMTNAVKQLQK